MKTITTLDLVMIIIMAVNNNDNNNDNSTPSSPTSKETVFILGDSIVKKYETRRA